MLLNVTIVTKNLPSRVKLKGNGREVRMLSPHAVRNGESYDIYRGEYLGEIQVYITTHLRDKQYLDACYRLP
jgi:hypothetical protein